MKIGVLGGIGPESTGEFYCGLIKKLQENGLIRSNRDFPQIVVNSIPAPELIHDSISDEDLQPYIDGLKELDRFGVDFIVMVCNTIHLFHEMLQKEVKTEIVDLRKELKGMLLAKGIKSTLIVGSPSTVRKGLYRCDGINCIEPDDAELKILSNAIFSFNKGVDKKEQVQKTRKICEKYLGKGAETVILGCTEFAVMLKDENIPKINTIDALAEAVVRRCKM